MTQTTTPNNQKRFRGRPPVDPKFLLLYATDTPWNKRVELATAKLVELFGKEFNPTTGIVTKNGRDIHLEIKEQKTRGGGPTAIKICIVRGEKYNSFGEYPLGRLNLKQVVNFVEKISVA